MTLYLLLHLTLVLTNCLVFTLIQIFNSFVLLLQYEELIHVKFVTVQKSYCSSFVSTNEQNKKSYKDIRKTKKNNTLDVTDILYCHNYAKSTLHITHYEFCPFNPLLEIPIRSYKQNLNEFLSTLISLEKETFSNAYKLLLAFEYIV